MPSATDIGDGAFYGASKLTSFYAEVLQTLGGEAFRGCANLATISVPKLLSVGNGAFSGCGAATLNLPAVVSMGSYACANMTNLDEVVVDSVRSLGSECFCGCSKLKTFQSEALSIGSKCFYGCSSLASFFLPNVSEIGSDCFAHCISLTNASLPNVTLMLGDCHFSGCSKLRYVSLPSLEYVSRGSANVFEGCHDLDRIDLPRSPPSFHDDVFRNAKELYEGVVPISLCLRSAEGSY